MIKVNVAGCLTTITAWHGLHKTNDGGLWRIVEEHVSLFPSTFPWNQFLACLSLWYIFDHLDLHEGCESVGPGKKIRTGGHGSGKKEGKAAKGVRPSRPIELVSFTRNLGR